MGHPHGKDKDGFEPPARWKALYDRDPLAAMAYVPSAFLVTDPWVRGVAQISHRLQTLHAMACTLTSAASNLVQGLAASRYPAQTSEAVSNGGAWGLLGGKKDGVPYGPFLATWPDVDLNGQARLADPPRPADDPLLPEPAREDADAQYQHKIDLHIPLLRSALHALRTIAQYELDLMVGLLDGHVDLDDVEGGRPTPPAIEAAYQELCAALVHAGEAEDGPLAALPPKLREAFMAFLKREQADPGGAATPMTRPAAPGLDLEALFNLPAKDPGLPEGLDIHMTPPPDLGFE
jgi:hypothetical protein